MGTQAVNEQRRLTAIMIAVAVIVLLAFAAATVNLIVKGL